MNKNFQTKKKYILITGSAGFIGFHVSKLFTEKKLNVVGIDNFDEYYSIELKKKRIEILKKNSNFTFLKLDLKNLKKLNQIFNKYKFSTVIHLAANPGVRFSILYPDKVYKNNIEVFFNLLKIIKNHNIKHLIFASTSSVYGNVKKLNYKEKDVMNSTLQLYSASKLTNEILAFTYSYLYKINTTGLRFFTVYGPWGRPDMSYYKFVKKILNKETIELYNYGKHQRDFTYIDDISNGIYNAYLLLPKYYRNQIKNKKIPNEIINLGNTKSIKLESMIHEIEKQLNFKAKIKYSKLQQGDMKNTKANISKAKKLLKFKPRTNFTKGIFEFIKWYKKFYNI